MKNVILYSLPLMVAGSIYCNTAMAANGIIEKKNNAATELVNSLKNKRHAAPVVKAFGFGNSSAKAAKSDSAEPYAQMQGPITAFLNDEDGNVWYYTQKNTYASQAYGANITKSVISVYDNKHELAGTIEIDVPDDMNVNDISPYGTVTKKFFDLNDKNYELLVELHETGNASNNYQGKYHTRAYHLDGTVAAEFEGAGVFLSIVKNSYTKYQRLIITDASLEEVEGKTYEDGSPYQTTFDNISIYGPASWSSATPTVEKTFKIDEDYTYYGNDGVPMSIYNINGEPYYVISHYSKIYDSGKTDEETGFFIPTEDNSVVIQTYDKKYNLVDDLNIPIEPASDTKYRMAQIGNFEDWSVTKGLFSNDGKLSYVLTYYDMTTKVDDYRYSFVAYDNTGNKLGTVCDGVYNTWFKLKSISGVEEQMAFMQYVDDDDTQQQIKIIRIPVLTEVATIPAYIDDNLVSTVFNRYGTWNNYKYLMKMGQGEVDADGNVIAKVAWLNRDFSVDHYTKFNLGKNAENFALTLSDTYMNPYLFNTSDKLEFFFQAKVKQDNSDKIDNVYMIADEDGNILRKFTNGDKGTISSVGCYEASNGENEMYIAYSDETSGNYNMDFYKLPLTKFDKGGEGTEQNPYLVATAGDLAAVADEPAACYKMVGDIDMGPYNATNSSWKPIANFTGKFDGDNHYIDDVQLNTDKSSAIGLFADLGDKSEVKNLVITSAGIKVNDNNYNVGTLAGTATNSKISNIHVYDSGIVSDSIDAMIGGLVGQAALYTNISGVSINYSGIQAPVASSVGGIAGDIRTSSVIEAAAVNGVEMIAGSNVGGVAGAAMQSTVRDCHVNGSFEADNTIGGIIGSNSSSVTDKCIFDGTVKANNASWNGLAAAGIVGSLDSDWDTSDTKAIITNNIANGNVEVGEKATDKESGTIHRIVGRTIANEDYEEGVTPRTELRLSNNWAISTMTVGGKTVTSTDENSVEGYDAALSDISTESLSQIGYAFGNDVEAPWKESGEAFPLLYFESLAKAIIPSPTYLEMEVGETSDALSAVVYGTDAGDLEVTSSDESVVEIAKVELDDFSPFIDVVTLHAIKDGFADITMSLDGISTVCKVAVGTATAIQQPTAGTNGTLLIVPGNGCVKATGATRMNVYTVSGSMITGSNGSEVATSQLGKGMYIVEAIAADGGNTSAKVIIR